MKTLQKSPGWQITRAKDFSAFVRALADLIPETAILYIEGGRPPKEVERFLETKRIADTTRVPTGTLLPRPHIYRIRATSENLNILATVSEQYSTPEGSIHVHVYQGDEVLLASFDAFLDPFWVSMSMPEDKVRRFCEALGVTYEKADAKRLHPPSLRR